MSEEEWCHSTKLEPMLGVVTNTWKHELLELTHWLGLIRRSPNERKLRLFGCACVRSVWDKIDRDDRNAVEVTERYADGVGRGRELKNAGHTYGRTRPVTYPFARDAARHGAGEAIAIAASNVLSDPARQPIEASLCNLFRCIFGNPFRPITINPSLLSTAIVNMAQAIYDERAFDRMPVLGDALEESGVTDSALLSHCREPGPHARGCHVLDMILGKG